MTGDRLEVMVVIEDDADYRQLIRLTLAGEERLRLAGEAATAGQAVPLARATQPRLIVLDHFIEGTVMGLELAPLLKEAAPDTAILLFSTHDLAVEAAREPAVDRFLRKSDLTRLLPTVREMLGLA